MLGETLGQSRSERRSIRRIALPNGIRRNTTLKENSRLGTGGKKMIETERSGKIRPVIDWVSNTQPGREVS